jgi:hypothetical protein
MLMAQPKDGYIPPAVQRAMDQHMQQMPANLQKYQGGNTYIPSQAQQKMSDYMQKTMPAHMQQYIGSYMEQKTISGLNSLDPVRPRTVQPSAPAPDLMRRDHSAFGEQFTVNVDPKVTADTPRSLAFTPQYSPKDNAPPPAPPSYNPHQADKNPYDFLNESPEPKKGLLKGQGPRQRLLIVLAGSLILLAIVALIISLAFGGAPSNKLELISIAQQQNEIIRVATIGDQKARESQAKSLGLTTKLTLISDQQPLLNALKSQKVKIAPKQLSAGKNPSTDQALTQAEQANRFDDEYIKTLQNELATYQKALKSAYDNPATGKKLKATIEKDYKNASLIIHAQPEL